MLPFIGCVKTDYWTQPLCQEGNCCLGGDGYVVTWYLFSQKSGTVLVTSKPVDLAFVLKSVCDALLLSLYGWFSLIVLVYWPRDLLKGHWAGGNLCLQISLYKENLRSSQLGPVSFAAVQTVILPALPLCFWPCASLFFSRWPTDWIAQVLPMCSWWSCSVWASKINGSLVA